MSIKKGGLGAGLSALFGTMDEAITSYDDAGNLNSGVTELSINKIIPNPDQPRKHFDELALRELAASINNFGVLQPLVVCKKDDNYLIVAGERRYRASQLAMLTKIPVIIKDLTDRQCKEIALIENLQREDLNPIEEAFAMKALLDEFNISQEDLAKRLGKSRPAVTNALRLLLLDSEVIDMVRSNRLSAGHARALASIKDKNVQLKYAIAACDKKMSVRELEIMVNAYVNPSKPVPKKKIKLSAELKELVSDMQRVFSTKIKAVGTEEKGRIYIDYYTADDLQRIFDIIENLKENK